MRRECEAGRIVKCAAGARATDTGGEQMRPTTAILIVAFLAAAVAAGGSGGCGRTEEKVPAAPCGAGTAQGAKDSDAPPSCGGAAPELARGGYRMLNETGTVEIPFELMDEHVVIPVSVNGSEPFHLVLDTGMPFYGATLDPSPRTDALELANPDSLKVMVAGQENYTPRVGSGVTLGLPGVELTGQVVTIFPLPGCEQVGTLLESDGVIGLSVFDNFVVEIDYDSQVLTLTEPDRFVYEGAGAEIPIRLGPVRMPEVEFAIEIEDGSSVPIGLVVDTGASLDMSITLGTDDKLHLPAGARDLVIGYSAWGEVRGKLGRAKSLSLGELRLQDVLVTFFEKGAPGVPPCGENGLVGSGVLQRFTVTFDYSSNRMFLEPGRRFAEPFEYSMTGFSYRRTDEGTFEVIQVFPDTPASENGVMVGDIILSVDGVPSRDYQGRAMRELMRKGVPKIELRIARNGNEMDVALKPRRLI